MQMVEANCTFSCKFQMLALVMANRNMRSTMDKYVGCLKDRV